jgi:Transcriptional regulator PadR-like family
VAGSDPRISGYPHTTLFFVRGSKSSENHGSWGFFGSLPVAFQKAVNQGTLYPVLLKLEQEGAISSEWGASENNRRARFYRLTRSGRKLLETETRDWEQTAAIIARFFAVKAEDLT